MTSQIIAELAPLLSCNDILLPAADATPPPPRWSSFNAPKPALIANVETENDVAVLVKYCANNDIPFVAQNGGHGWANTFNLGSNGVLINLAKLNTVTVNKDRTGITIGGGSSVKQVIDMAYSSRTIVAVGNCNQVGALGAILGGGYSHLLGICGYGVDNVLSLLVVTADGNIHNVDASSDPDLFWALRGAAPNLGIVTSATVKSYPAINDQDLMAWTGGIIFSPDKLERVVQAMEKIQLQPEMSAFMYFISGIISPENANNNNNNNNNNNSPVILVSVFLYKGNVETGHQKFADFYDIGPTHDLTAVVPYNGWNAGGDAFCVSGARKPAYSVAVKTMRPVVWLEIWDKYVEFQSKPSAQRSILIVESYSLNDSITTTTQQQQQHMTLAAFPHRNASTHVLVIPWYDDPSLDTDANIFGSAVRQLLRDTDELSANATYINFAHGDEDLTSIYGSSLERLRHIKHRVDPTNRFNQWFNIK